MKKADVENAIVVFDTSSIQAGDKILIINDKSCKFIKEFSDKCLLEWVVPEVVSKELFTHFRDEVQKAHKSANSGIKRINAALEIDRKFQLSSQKLTERCEEIFEKKLKKLSIRKVPLNKSLISVNSLYESVMNKLAPFSGEKDHGLKDFFILENLKTIYENRENKKVVFICADEFFRDAVIREFENKTDFGMYETVDEYESYLRLKLEEKSESWIAKVTERANKRFYDEKANSGLLVDESIIEDINSLIYERGLAPDVIRPSEFGLFVNGIYTPSGKSDWRIGKAIYVDHINSTMEWKHFLSLIKEYTVQPFSVSSNDLTTGMSHVYLSLTFLFFIYWNGKVTSDAKILQPRLSKIELEHRSLTSKDKKSPNIFESLFGPGKKTEGELPKVLKEY